jgi:L-erythro-3,5-diaminohexanoate dehydrogenase
MHNPVTDSGGILAGTVSAVGEAFEEPPDAGDRVATLGSLTLTPLRLERVTRVDPESPQVDVEGTAYVFQRAPWAPIPDDLPLTAALEVFDVCAVASQTRRLTFAGATVCVLGAGNAGRLALAAARDAAGDGTVVAIDADQAAVDTATGRGLCDIGVVADLRDPVATVSALRDAGVPPADLTVVVVNCSRCEPAAILITAQGGTALFFSMATRFGSAALAADGVGSDVRMVIGSGYAPDRGAYALELVRSSPGLRESFGLAAERKAA